MIVVQPCHVTWGCVPVAVRVEIAGFVATMIVMLTTSLLRHFRSPRDWQNLVAAAFQVQSQSAGRAAPGPAVDKPLIHSGLGLRSNPQIGLERRPTLRETGPRLIVGQRRHDDHIFS